MPKRSLDSSPSRTFFAGWLLDGTGAPAGKGVLVKVRDGTITSIEPACAGREDMGRSVDLSACTLIPPLVEAHAHICLSGSVDADVRRRQLSYGFEDAIPVMKAHLLSHWGCGILAVRDGGDYGAHALNFKDRRLAGLSLPVRLKAAGRAWHAAGRYGKLIGRSPAAGLPLSKAFETHRGRADHLKIVNSGLNSLQEFGRETPPQFDASDLSETFLIARQRGMRVMVHANGRIPVRSALDAGCDSIEHGFFMGSENLRRMAERRITWVPTAVTMRAYDQSLPADSPERSICRRNLEAQLDLIMTADSLGVPLATGSDAGSLGVHHGRGLVEELELFLEAGLTVERAVQCATSTGAALLGLERELGVIAEGRPASFLAVQGPPHLLVQGLRKAPRIYIRGVLALSPEALDASAGAQDSADKALPRSSITPRP